MTELRFKEGAREEFIQEQIKAYKERIGPNETLSKHGVDDNTSITV